MGLPYTGFLGLAVFDGSFCSGFFSVSSFVWAMRVCSRAILLYFLISSYVTMYGAVHALHISADVILYLLIIKLRIFPREKKRGN